MSSNLSPPSQITNDKPLQCPSVYQAIATLKGSVSFWQSTNKKLHCTAWGALPEVFSCSFGGTATLGIPLSRWRFWKAKLTEPWKEVVPV